MAKYPQIIIGTYEEFLLGYEIEKPNDVYTLNLTMASHAHQGSIRCVAAHSHFLATSGADEYVNIFSMINRKEIAVLTPHAGTVTCLTFAPDGTHLISGSQDGSIVIFRCSDWTMVKVWKDAHKKSNGVISLSVHPTGKLLLSIGGDNVLRAWNLIKGRQAYAVNLGKHTSVGNTLNLVTWSGDGNYYAVSIGDTVMIYSVESAAVVFTIKKSQRITCFDLILPGIIAMGTDDGTICIYNIETQEQILEQKSHEKRVKCLSFFVRGKEHFLVSADSQGVIRLWTWKKNRPSRTLHQEAEVTTDCRIICLTLLDPNKFVKSEEEAEKPEGVEKESNANVECVVVDDEKSPQNGTSSKRKKKATKDPDSSVKVTPKSNKKRKSLEFAVSPATSPRSKKGSSTSKWKVT